MKWLLSTLLALAPLLAAGQTLTVSAAASLREGFEALGPRFAARHPGVQLRFNFAASGALQQQIANGAPVDVFASADADTMDRAAPDLLADSRRDFIGNALVMVTPPGSRLRLEELAAPGVRRIAIGKPASVPAGRYAQRVLEARQLWGALQPKLVFADNVRQVLDYVARGEAEAGFVYRSDAVLLAQRVHLGATLGGPADIRYPVAIVRHSPQPRLAAAFVAYLGSTEAQAVLRQHGFSPLP